MAASTIHHGCLHYHGIVRLGMTTDRTRFDRCGLPSIELPATQLIFLLPYRPPYHWTAMLAFLAARSVPATELIEGEVYHRSMRLGDAAYPIVGTASVSHEIQHQALRLSLSPDLARGATDALARIRRLFDVDCDPQAIEEVLGDLARSDPGLRLPGAVDPFEIAVRAILGQQITVAAARTLATRFVARFGCPLPARFPLSDQTTTDNAGPGLTHLFPLASSVAVLDPAQLGEIGIIRTRGQAIIAVAQALSAGTLRLGVGATVEPTLAALTSIRGIGPWTAHYIAMRSLGWTDAFPPGDVVVLKALQVATPAAAAALAKQWQPWRAYAVLHLWRRMALSPRGSAPIDVQSTPVSAR